MNIGVLLLIIALCCVLGGGLGLICSKKGNFPEFFSPQLSNTDMDFLFVSQDLCLVNQLSDEELTYEFFTKSR